MAAAAEYGGGGGVMDPHLPQLEILLDPEAMLAEFSREWVRAGGAYKPLRCEIGMVRHKPGKNCLVRYELVIADRERGSQLRQTLCARAYGEGGSAMRWEKAKAQPLTDVAAGPALAHMARLGLVVWAFPNERKLRGLEVLLDVSRLRLEILPGVLGVEHVGDVRSEVVRYVPEHGCTVRVQAGERVLYGKLQCGDEAARAYSLGRKFGRSVYYHAPTKTLWQDEIPGAAAALTDDLTPCAKALAEFHTQPSEGLEVATANLSGVAATVHGDLHLKNFLLHAGTAALIDLDTVHAGDPVAELGSFAASLYHRALLGEATVSCVDRVVAEFRETYAALVPWDVTERALAEATARALLHERVPRSVSRRKGDVAAELAETAERLLRETSAQGTLEWFERAARGRRGEVLDVYFKTYRKAASWRRSEVTVAWRENGRIQVERIGARTSSWVFPNDPAAPWMAEVADAGAVRRHLPVEAERVGVQVLNYRPGQRLTARYELETAAGRRTVFGKTYAGETGRVVDERFRLLAAAGLPIPSPLGYSAPVRTVWQEAFAGHPLGQRMTGPDAPALVAIAARRLRQLHQSGIPCPPRETLAEQFAELRHKVSKLAVFVPELSARLLCATERLGDAMAGLTAPQTGIVHGDLHLGQFMASTDDVVLFDFDEIGYGDTAEDFGNFIAALRTDPLDTGATGDVVHWLLAAYAAAPGCAVPADRLRWHTAARLLTRAYRGLLQLRPDFEAGVERTLRMVEEMH
ncbi:MAG: phosphotransferase [Bryobacterales bacterium]|nr:phosphotransferase [Bryobacterales bacterium]